jgi:hypothetical protein
LTRVVNRSEEQKIFSAKEKPITEEERQRETALAFYGHGKTGVEQPGDLLKHLLIFLRYDAHYFREFYRALAMLLAAKGGSHAGLTKLLTKTFAQNKENSEESND